MRCLITLARCYVRLYPPCEDMRQDKSPSLNRTSADVMGWDGRIRDDWHPLTDKLCLHFIAKHLIAPLPPANQTFTLFHHNQPKLHLLPTLQFPPYVGN